MKNVNYLILSLFIITLSCNDDDGPTILPLSNLTAISEVSIDGSGDVVIRAHAPGATSYTYDFGDGTTGESLNGYIVKNYEMTGDNTYTIKITAYDASGASIETTIDVSVSVAADTPEEINLLTNGSTKTWFLAASQPGHLGVGPAREGIDGDWWYPKWYSANAYEKCGSDDSDCFCDDELTFTLSNLGILTYELNNMGQTYFNVGHKDVVGSTSDEDFCADYDTSGEKMVSISMVEGNVPETETTGVQLEFSDGGFMSYYVGSSTYEILSITENLLYVRTYDSANAELAWYLKFASAPEAGGEGEKLETIYTNLVWSDEFDVDGVPNPENWTFDLGGGGWGNGEAQVYTDNPENVTVADGILKITAKSTGSGGGGIKHYYDDLTLVASDGTANVVEDFEGSAPMFTGFGGASSVVIENPDASGDNLSNKVAESLKNSGAETWAGTFFDVDTPLDLDTYSTMSIKTWAPATGAVVRLKLENKSNAEEFVEVDATTTVADAWETLTFDLSAAPDFTYDRIVLFFDFGVSPMGGAYTSARLKSENLFEFTHGRVEIRAKLPSAGGTWPALWALGADFDSVGWPACGEMDILEHVGNNPNVVSSALHYPGNSGGTAVTGSTPLATATTEFHNYTIEWSPESIKFVVDDELVHLNFMNSASTPFNKDFFLIMNIAMGGTLGGSIDPAFTEDSMEIDYVRVYQ